MNRTTVLAVAGLLLSLQPGWAEDAQGIAESLKVVRISDGDTIGLEKTAGEKALKIRMIGMDTPELHLPVNGKNYSQGHWAEEATRYLERLIPVGTRVQLKSYGVDNYGRTLGRILKDGRDINLEMVRAGFAIPYIICEGEDCNDTFMKRHAVEDYIEACRVAQSNGRGIFDPKDPLEEMPFEFRLRLQERKPDKYVGDYDSGTLYEPARYARVELCQRIFFMRKKDAEYLGYRPAR
jgi:endonuclease YncB( thermonuclease family)